MTTLSVPLTPELAKFVDDAVKSSGLTKSDIMRQALTFYAEEQAINAVFRAEREVSDGKLLRGTPREILLK